MEFSNKKHAYLIIAHNNWKQLSLLLSVLDDERNDIYIHIDKKSKNSGNSHDKRKSPLFLYWYLVISVYYTSLIGPLYFLESDKDDSLICTYNNDIRLHLHYLCIL